MRQRKILRRFLCAAALAALAAGAAAGAAGGSVPPLPADPGKTTVGVQTADLDPASLSFTVPLYLTVAATQDSAGQPKVIAPDGYLLRNTTGSTSAGDYPGIAVTGVEVRSVSGGTWSLKGVPSQEKEIKLTIGGLTLPDVAAGHKMPVPADITAAESCFYDHTAGRFRPIPGGPAAMGMELPVVGALWQGYTSEEAPAAAQFRVAYTVSLLDESGRPVGVSYDGPTLEDAATPAPSSTPTAP